MITEHENLAARLKESEAREKILKEALIGIAWQAGSSPCQSVLQAIKYRAERALLDGAARRGFLIVKPHPRLERARRW